MAWTYAKRAFHFAELTQDGEAEGILFLNRLPKPSEAVAIRKVLGIRKRRKSSLIDHLQPWDRRSRPRIGGGSAGPMTQEKQPKLAIKR